MTLYLPPPSTQVSSRPLVSEPDDLGYVHFHREQTATKLRDYLLIDNTQLDAIIADIDLTLQLPLNAALIRPHTRIRGKEICANVRQIALDIEQRHSRNCNFAFHPDVRLLQCSLWDIVKKRIAFAKHSAAMNNSGQMFTSSSPAHGGETSVGNSALHLGQKRVLEDASPTPSKKLSIMLPMSTPAPLWSPYSPPAIPNDLQPQATSFNNCTVRVTGSRIAPEYHAPLTRYLFQTINPYVALTVADLDYEKWLLDLQRSLNFSPLYELLQYRTPYGGPVYIRNAVEWRCAISEMASNGMTVLDFEIVRQVPGFTPINSIMPEYDASFRPNLFSPMQNNTTPNAPFAAVNERYAVKKFNASEVPGLPVDNIDAVRQESFRPLSTRDASTMACVVTFKLRD